VLAACGYLMEEYRQDLPPLIGWQSFAYRMLARFDPQRSFPDHLIVVEIDDPTWEKEGYAGITDRHFLGTLIRRAARAGAAEVVLDINLSVQRGADRQPDRIAGNRDLLAAINEVAKRSPPVPVIVGVGFHDGTELPNVFADNDLPRVVGGDSPIGFDNAAIDERKLPLVANERRYSDQNVVPFYSLALRAADTYGRLLHFQSPIAERAPVGRAIHAGEFVYSTFLPDRDFDMISALRVADGRPDALERLAHRIVLIGGNRHDNSGVLLDNHDTPIGSMVGVYIHANRIEALLQGHMKGTLPPWVPVLVDLTLGLTLVLLWSRSKTVTARLWLIALFAIPIATAYVLFVNLQYALDFALPLFVLMIDLGLEAYHGLGQHSKEPVHAAV
jgi:CHASE2 domain-containing sensor protein